MNEPPPDYSHLSIEEEARIRGVTPFVVETERRINGVLANPEFWEGMPLSPEFEENEEEAEPEDETTARLAKIQGEQEILERIQHTADPEVKAKLFKLWQKGKL